ncbi:MAG: aminodeoxychorismate/anthranilate synthase component II [Deltaproteobacteria bacterium]|nr:MAG: aminodeoxychorismate/anthranilate synthase component II [Deltaproteobacteria bacterium]
MNILMIDNYDSFTYNLVQYLGELGAHLQVFRNNKVSLKEIESLNPDKIVISPGPGRPVDAGISRDIVRHFAPKKWILGVCLGHQCIGEVFGGRVVRAEAIMHGKSSLVHHDGKRIYRGLPNPFEAMRYHSLVLDPETLPEALEVVARTADGVIMGVRHREFNVEGVQFHPESFLTSEGKRLLKNFLKL